MNNASTPKGFVSFLESTTLLTDASMFLDFAMSTGSPILAISQGSLPPSFYDLKSGLAGEIFQKAANYRVQLIIIGDFEKIESKSFRDLIWETNQRGQVVFTSSFETGLDLLA